GTILSLVIALRVTSALLQPLSRTHHLVQSQDIFLVLRPRQVGPRPCLQDRLANSPQVPALSDNTLGPSEGRMRSPDQKPRAPPSTFHRGLVFDPSQSISAHPKSPPLEEGPERVGSPRYGLPQDARPSGLGRIAI